MIQLYKNIFRNVTDVILCHTNEHSINFIIKIFHKNFFFLIIDDTKKMIIMSKIHLSDINKKYMRACPKTTKTNVLEFLSVCVAYYLIESYDAVSVNEISYLHISRRRL